MSLATIIARLKAIITHYSGASDPFAQRLAVSQMPLPILLTYLAALEAGRQPEGWTNFPYDQDSLARLIRLRALNQQLRG